MKPENSGLFLLVLLIFGGAFYTLTGVPATTGPTAKGTQEASKTQTNPSTESQSNEGLSCSGETTRLLGEFFGVDSKKVSSPDFFVSGKGKDYTLDFLMATVPDPIDSHVGWSFDSFVDAIQRAIERSGFVMDRFYLPWEVVRQAKEKGGNESLDLLHEKTPGVILFRKYRYLLVLFLIGETPTSGIQKAAFNCALDSLAAYKLTDKAWDQHVRIMGPTYSGSRISLKMAIERWFETYENRRALPNLRFDIVSGSATNPDNKSNLDSHKDEKPEVSFHATVISDDIILDAFKRYLKEKLHDDSPVAVLTESNTSYGQGLVNAQKEQKVQNWVSLPFPMNISRVRSAFGKDTTSKEQPNQLPGSISEIPRFTLELPMDEIENPRDVVPAQAPLMTPVVVERMLANILSTISRGGFRYVGLFATDTRDKLFLARQIRQYCPDVRLFTIGSDLLYTHPSYASYLDGMIVVSTYPLFDKNQLWSFPFQGENGRLQFPVESVEGTYNATLALLSYDTQRPLLNPAPDLDLVEYAPPLGAESISGNRKPPVWLTVVGHGGLWPLKVDSKYQDKDQDKDYVFPAAAIRKDQKPPWPLNAPPPWVLVDSICPLQSLLPGQLPGLFGSG